MAERAIHDVFVAEGTLTVDSALRVLHQKYPRVMADPAAVEVITRAIQISWSDGIELGLAIAVRDMAPARRLLNWIRTEILENDPDTRMATDTSVDAFYAVLER